MSSGPSSGLVVSGLSKTYSGQRALDALDFDVVPGEVHALLGHNGSGKSTLIKVLSGYHQPDPGARLDRRSRAAARVRRLGP